MNVLLLHNRYREPGGEERSLEAIARLLRDRGHDVELLVRQSDSLGTAAGRLRSGAALVAGGLRPGEVAAAVRRHRAEVVHAHNVHPLFGARALAAARAQGARVVLHLHNYRLVCAIAIAYRDGDVCTRCHGRDTWPGVRLRCRGNQPEALAYGAGLALQQRRLLASADALVAPSAFARDQLTAMGVPAARAAVLPNFVREAELASGPGEGSGYALYAGRLVEEKGAATAIEAAARADVPIALAGSGPHEPELRALAARSGADARFLGRLDAGALARARREASFAVVPSRWHEPCPYAALEAMASGLPVLASAMGGLPELVGADAALPARDVGRWAAAMAALHGDPAKRRAEGAAALARVRELFGEERFYSGLMDVYGARA